MMGEATLTISFFERWFRYAPTRHGGSFIIPHSMAVYLVFNALFSGLLIAYCSVGLSHTIPGSDLRNIIIWKSSIWIFLWASGWSLAVCVLFPLLFRSYLSCSVLPLFSSSSLRVARIDTDGSNRSQWSTAIQPLLLPGREVDPNSFDFSRHPRKINAIMIAVPVAFLLSEQICAGISAVHYNAAFSAYRAVDPILTSTI